jgi:hypothetical protein
MEALLKNRKQTVSIVAATPANRYSLVTFNRSNINMDVGIIGCCESSADDQDREGLVLILLRLKTAYGGLGYG